MNKSIDPDMQTADDYQPIQDKLEGDGSISSEQRQDLMTELRALPLNDDGTFDRADIMGLVRQLVRKEKQDEIKALLTHVAPGLAETQLGQNLLKGKRADRPEGGRRNAPGGDRPEGGRRGPPRGERQDGERRGPPRGERPEGARRGPPRGERPEGERRGPPRGERPDGERRGPPRGERPEGERRGPPRGERPEGERRGPPRGERPEGARRGPPRGERPEGERRGPPRGERPEGERRGPPRGERPEGAHRGPPRGERPGAADGEGPRQRRQGQSGQQGPRGRALTGQRREGRGERGKNRFGSSFPRSFEEFTAESGPIPDDFSEVLDLDYAKDYAPPLESFQTRYKAVLDFHPGYGKTEEEHELFLRRLRWGHNFYRFVRFVRTHGSIMAYRNPDLPDSDKVMKIAAQIKDRVIMPDMSEVLENVENGRSISFIGIHQGYHWLNKAAKDFVQLPRVHITKSGAAEPIGDDIVFKAEDADPTAFLKLIKDIRKRQVMIELHPDGRNGELVRRPLFNNEVDIGVGFTSLTWHSKAALYSLGTNWDGENFKIEVKKEPDPRDFEDSEAFVEAALDSYVEIVRTAYLEEPENLRLPRLVNNE